MMIMMMDHKSNG